MFKYICICSFFWGGGSVQFLPFCRPLRGLNKIEDWVFDTLQNLCKKYTKWQAKNIFKLSTQEYTIHHTGCHWECQYKYLYGLIVFWLFVSFVIRQLLRSREQFVPVLTLSVNRVHTIERLVRFWITKYTWRLDWKWRYTGFLTWRLFSSSWVKSKFKIV